jgi:isopentenyldiphosphate isomerase
MTYLNYENERYLDVVDEDDQVIDSCPRNEIHEFGLLHRDVHVWMFDEEHNVFFQKRGLPVSYPGLLDASVGGHVNSGEDYLSAAIRETSEETSIIPKPHELVFIKKFNLTTLIPDSIRDPVDNLMRSVYVYKHPIKEENLEIEEGIPGTEFKKISSTFLKNLRPEDKKMFIDFVREVELPMIIEYLEGLPG